MFLLNTLLKKKMTGGKQLAQNDHKTAKDDHRMAQDDDSMMLYDACSSSSKTIAFTAKRFLNFFLK